MNHTSSPLHPPLKATIEKLTTEFDQIAEVRKELLHTLTDFIVEKVKHKKHAYLNFICTHNSRRSHIAQLWAQAAAHYYSIPLVTAFSGGTEATSFNPRAVKALQDAGFGMTRTNDDSNPVYFASFTSNEAVKTFSKKYDDPANPNKDFAAIMTCSHADENCPLIPGASRRIPLTYDDPKDFDFTPQEEIKYRERVMEIGRDILYAFFKVKSASR